METKAIPSPVENEQPTHQPSLLDDIVKHTTQATQSSNLPGIMLAELIAVDTEGSAQVLMMGENNTQRAWSLCPVSTSDIGKVCAVQYVNNNPQQPLIIGLLQQPHQPRQEPEPTMTLLQGDQQVVISASEELVLVCGQSSIVMSADGVIQIRALYIDSQAQATHRLKGGSMQLN
ncbi:DUF6484 domain-containing protein [Serratia microhaemolytica]|uniref:DUF6484 domain-containing protein n=1 Tax=Serratia microhaemolytica TaxID=2675110 RepID=UPI000FDCF577|nr:DUF6484 domain-containing protein [Serratia microhaemolytica]